MGRRTPYSLSDHATSDPASGWTARLGDLVHDHATGKVGVVVEIPGEAVFGYHLRPEGQGAEREWTAPPDGHTLTPVPDANPAGG